MINDLLIAAEKRGVLVARAELTPFGMSDRVEGVVVQKGEQHFLLFTRDGLWLINEVRLTDAGAWEHDNMLCGDLGPTSATASDAIDIALTKRFVDSYPPSDARVPITGPDFGIPFSTAE